MDQRALLRLLLSSTFFGHTERETDRQTDRERDRERYVWPNKDKMQQVSPRRQPSHLASDLYNFCGCMMEIKAILDEEILLICFQG